MKRKIQNTKNIIAFLIICPIVFSLVAAYWVIGDIKGARENLNINFAGKVERIQYDIKQFPTIAVNGSTYYIGYNTDNQIEVGDSLIKRKGSDVYILIKEKTHKTIKFTK